jgi:hypothetical protein
MRGIGFVKEKIHAKITSRHHHCAFAGCEIGADAVVRQRQYQRQQTFHVPHPAGAVIGRSGDADRVREVVERLIHDESIG